MTLRMVFRTERGLRLYEFVNDSSGEILSLEETPEQTLAFRWTGEKKEMDITALVQGLVPLLEHFRKYGNLPLPEVEAANIPSFQVDDRVTCFGEGGKVLRIAKISEGVEERTGSAFLCDEAGEPHGWEDFHKLRRL